MSTGGETRELCSSWVLFQDFGDVIQSDILDIKINDLRGARATGGTSYMASNIPVIFIFLGSCFTPMFHATAYHW